MALVTVIYICPTFKETHYGLHLKTLERKLTQVNGIHTQALTPPKTHSTFHQTEGVDSGLLTYTSVSKTIEEDGVKLKT